MRAHALRLLAISTAGMTLLTANVAARHELDDGQPPVVSVSSVAPGGAADLAGVRTGDRILSWGEASIETEEELQELLRSYRPGDRVDLTLEREGERLELPLVFGERDNGEVSLGISLVMGSAEGAAGRADGLTAEECAFWIESTYGVAEIAAELDLDLKPEVETNRACVDRDTQRMAEPIPLGWCDNVFKIHCSGLDLLTEIGEALVERCASMLSADLEIDVSLSPAWSNCAAQKVFDRYSRGGETTDVTACRQILVEECGAEIDG